MTLEEAKIRIARPTDNLDALLPSTAMGWASGFFMSSAGMVVSTA